MAENEAPADQLRSVMTKNLEQAHGALLTIFSLLKRAYQHRRWARQIRPKLSDAT